MGYVVYGIKQCDTVRKSLKWLEQKGIAHQFHDIREQPLDVATIQAWAEQLGVDVLVNKRSTSWRQLSAAEQNVDSPAAAAALIKQYPTLMKRPLLEGETTLLCGFKDAQWQTQLI